MTITIKDIAALAGVSRGTVDRVLHNRGRVKSDVKDRIMAIAQNAGYKPSRAAKQLVAQRQKLKFGIICHNDANGFWSSVLQGVDSIEQELAEYSITVLRRYFNSFEPEDELAFIDELVAEGISGLVIVPLNDDKIREKLKHVQAAGIIIVTINSEINGFNSFCYIGNDYYRNGRTAAGLLHLFSRGEARNLMILTGTYFMMSHQQRIDGFIRELAILDFPYTFSGSFEITADGEFAYKTTFNLLRQYPDTDAIFTAAGNVGAVCQAIKDLNRAGRIIHIAFDLSPMTRPRLIEGSLTAVIGQEAFRQGYQSLKILFDYLVCGIEPECYHILTHNEIYIKQNCL
jgi:LacI family transcriptional regulator